MNWTERRHAAEALIEWGAPALLGAALGWAAHAVSSGFAVGLAATVVGLGLGVAAMRSFGVDEMQQALAEFAPEPFDARSDELLLDDPLGEVAVDSRVVALFEPEAQTPGSIVARIADYLGERGQMPPTIPETDEGGVASDAGAALHAALANIRASLR